MTPIEPRRHAFTWRLTNDRADAFDELVQTARRAQGRPVRKQELADAMLEVVAARPKLTQAVVRRLKSGSHR